MSEREKLTEPLASVTEYFGALMLLALAVFGGLWAFGSGSFGGSQSLCESQPGITYGGSWQPADVAARPGASMNVNTTVQACAVHPGIGQWALYGLAQVPTVLAWCGVLLLLWRLVRIADREGPFTPAVATAMRRLGWFILAGSLTVALLRALGVYLLLDGMLTGQTTGATMIPGLVWGVVRSVMPVPALAGAALLSLARIFRVGVAMNDELKGTV
jgi:hypothetical protein